MLVRAGKEEDLKISFQSYFGNAPIIELNEKIDEALKSLGKSAS